MNFSTGLSAIRANQTALAVVGHNIANANTDGFVRRDVLFSENPTVNLGGHLIGQGVSVDAVRRLTNGASQDALNTVLADSAFAELRLTSLNQLESMLTPGNGSLLDRLETFFNELEGLSRFPDDAALRTTVVRSAEGLADEISRLSGQLTEFSQGFDSEIDSAIVSIQEISTEIADLNNRIINSEATGGEASDLRDRRDNLVRELSQLTDVTVNRSDGNFDVLIGGQITIGSTPPNITAERNSDGIMELWHPLCDGPLAIEGGRLGALLAASNDGASTYQQSLQELTAALVSAVDSAHAFGVGIRGDFTSLSGSRSFDDVTTPLGLQELPFPVTNGELFITVTEAATGNRQLHRLDIDPQTQSLTDIGGLISGIDRLSATTPTDGGIFGIVADEGYSFSFTGNLQQEPVNVAITGTTTASFDGRFALQENDELTFQFANSGTIGATDGLSLEVYDSDNDLVAILSVGAGYEPGTPLQVVPGVELTLSAGTANAGDSFELSTVGVPDTSGLLSALGLNTLFAGDSPTTLHVNPLISEDPSRLATTVLGHANDTTNLVRMVNVRDEKLLGNGTQTIEQFVANMIAEVGLEVRDLEQIASNNADLEQTIRADMEALSGVDINEEVAKMLQYQRSFQAAAQYISAIDESLQTLMAIIR